MSDNFPDRLSIVPGNPHYDEAVLSREVGILFNGAEKTNVEEYCISEGWIKVAIPRTLDRHGNPMMIRLRGKVEPFYKKAATEEQA